MSQSSPEIPFEEALARLEGVVGRLEAGDLSLEESLRCFEEGIALQRRCIAQLDAAQQQIEVLQAPATPPAAAARQAAVERGENGLRLSLEEPLARG